MILAVIEVAAYPETSAGLLAWIHELLYLAFTVALVVVLLVRAVGYARDRFRVRRAGGQFFTARFIKWFLIVGWVFAVLFRFATFGDDIPVAVSVGPFWLFSIGLIVFFVGRRLRRRGTA